MKLRTYSEHQGAYPPQGGTIESTPLWGVSLLFVTEKQSY